MEAKIDASSGPGSEDIPEHYQQILEHAPEVIYHYTTTQGLMGIIREQSVWATDIGYLNDSSELTYALSMLRKEWSQQIKKVETGDLGDVLSDLLDAPFVFSTFVACFCEEGDLLSQWRGYGSPGGYAIGFNTRKLLMYLIQQKKAMMAPIEYRRERAQDAASKWASGAVDKWKDNFPDGFPAALKEIAKIEECIEEDSNFFKKDPKSFIEQIVTSEETIELAAKTMFEYTSDAIGHLALAAAYYKDPSFSEEKEWRISCLRASGLRELPEDLYFREGPLGLTPYTKVSFQDSPENSPIQKIIIGPGGDFESRRKAVSMFINTMGYGSGVEILPSDIPFRG